jgi:hypothetical protein
LSIYKLHRIHRSQVPNDGPTEDVRDVDAPSEQQAIIIAQAVAAKPESDLLAIELRDPTERVLWRLSRGDVISQRPRDV